MYFNHMDKVDPVIADMIRAEMNRQEHKVELIASENFTSKAVMEACGSALTNKYAEGYPGKRYYGGCECVDPVEDLARERGKKLFGAEWINVQPHSGSSANLAAYASILKHGDTVLGMDLSNGGHLTHGSPVNASGINYNFVPYQVNPETERIDFDLVRKLAKEHQPKLIVAGASAYPRIVDAAIFREIADEVGAMLMVDMAHFAGLVAAGLHPSPVPYADIVTSTTHKTLRGPRGGIIISKKELGPKIDKAIFPGNQGGPLMHIIAGKAVCFEEASRPEFVEYQKQVLKNINAMADVLLEEGFRLVSGGTDNHLILVDVTSKNLSGKEAEHILDECGITTNKNTIPNDPKGPMVTSGIRLGSPAMTTRGLKEDDFRTIGRMIALVLNNPNSPEAFQTCRDTIAQLCAAYPLY